MGIPWEERYEASGIQGESLQVYLNGVWLIDTMKICGNGEGNSKPGKYQV